VIDGVGVDDMTHWQVLDGQAFSSGNRSWVPLPQPLESPVFTILDDIVISYAMGCYRAPNVSRESPIPFPSQLLPVPGGTSGDGNKRSRGQLRHSGGTHIPC